MSKKAREARGLTTLSQGGPKFPPNRSQSGRRVDRAVCPRAFALFSRPLCALWGGAMRCHR
jgi:hypothetical protein